MAAPWTSISTELGQRSLEQRTETEDEELLRGESPTALGRRWRWAQTRADATPVRLYLIGTELRIPGGPSPPPPFPYTY